MEPARMHPHADIRISPIQPVAPHQASHRILAKFCTLIYDCDAIIEVDSSDNWAIGQYEVFNFLMLLFSGLLAYYLRQRMYFPSDFDWVDFVTIKITSSLLVVLWIDELIYKSHGAIDALLPIIGQIANRNNDTAFIPPCKKQKHSFKCHPEDEFKKNGSKLYWYRLDEYLIHQVVASLACEYYPVLLVIHWVVTGRANNAVEKIIQRQEQSKSIELPLRQAAACISRVPELEFIEVPPMTIEVSFLAKFLFNCLAILTVISALVCAMADFYQIIDSNYFLDDAILTLCYIYTLSSILLFVLTIAKAIMEVNGRPRGWIGGWCQRLACPTVSSRAFGPTAKTWVVPAGGAPLGFSVSGADVFWVRLPPDPSPTLPLAADRFGTGMVWG
ncbi:hypothetical protein Ddc_02211 [Ditylenchus destructor]|nr:hypothetical protein Ddc_02211 [Ditylenchus destructor]